MIFCCFLYRITTVLLSTSNLIMIILFAVFGCIIKEALRLSLHLWITYENRLLFFQPLLCRRCGSFRWTSGSVTLLSYANEACNLVMQTNSNKRLAIRSLSDIDYCLCSAVGPESSGFLHIMTLQSLFTLYNFVQPLAITFNKRWWWWWLQVC